MQNCFWGPDDGSPGAEFPVFSSLNLEISDHFWVNRQAAAFGALLALAAAGLLVYLAFEAATYFYEPIE